MMNKASRVKSHTYLNNMQADPGQPFTCYPGKTRKDDLLLVKTTGEVVLDMTRHKSTT